MMTTLAAHTIHVRSTLEVDLERGRRRGGGLSHPAWTVKRKGGGSLIHQALASNKLKCELIDRAPELIDREETV
jgi:hypothetical protein